MGRETIKKAAGTYTFSDIVLRQPARLLGPPKQRASDEDISAVRAGEARLVSCFLTGPRPPYPLKSTQGSLVLHGKTMTWTPFWNRKREPLTIQELPEAVEPHNTTVTCMMPSGRFDFRVPEFDLPLVLDFLGRLSSGG